MSQFSTSKVPNCPDCGRPGQCTDQWMRQYDCHCGGRRKVFAPDWYIQQSQEYSKSIKKALDSGDRDRALQIVEAGKPWNACAEHDMRNQPPVAKT